MVWRTHTWICIAKSLCSGQEAPRIHFLLKKSYHQQADSILSAHQLVRHKQAGRAQTLQLRHWDLEAGKTLKSHTVHSLGTVLLPRKVTVWRYLVLVTQECPTGCNPMDCNLPGSSVHRIFQARTLEWVAISFRGSSQPRSRTRISTRVSCLAGGSEPTGKPKYIWKGIYIFLFRFFSFIGYYKISNN